MHCCCRPRRCMLPLSTPLASSRLCYWNYFDFGSEEPCCKNVVAARKTNVLRPYPPRAAVAVVATTTFRSLAARTLRNLEEYSIHDMEDIRMYPHISTRKPTGGPVVCGGWASVPYRLLVLFSWRTGPRARWNHGKRDKWRR